jgi:hypothetical protein
MRRREDRHDVALTVILCEAKDLTRERFLSSRPTASLRDDSQFYVRAVLLCVLRVSAVNLAFIERSPA